MAQIKVRNGADGMRRYTVFIRLRKGGSIIHQESKTFTLRTAAEKWARNRQVLLDDPAMLVRERQLSRTLAQLIRWYIDTFQTVSRWQRSKQAHLEFLENHPVGKTRALELTSADLVDHIRSRRAAGAGPATVANDLTWIGVVFRAAKSVEAIPVHPEIVEQARTACRELRLTGKSRRRERRPSLDELARLAEYFQRRDQRAELPMVDIMDFAIESARRQSEICRLEAADNDRRTRTGLVRDAKHPRHKEGNHRRFKYTCEAWAIVERQPKTSEFIFPYNARSICAAFTRACQFLGIADLHFHDLRHEATSRLFERGYQIQEVAQFTLHDSWNELKRYTNLRPEKLREIPLVKEGIRQAKPRRSSLKPAIAQAEPSRAADRSARQGRSHLPATEISDHPA